MRLRITQDGVSCNECNHQGYPCMAKWVMYSRAHKLFGHSRVFILTILICVKRIIFSNDCISKRLKDRKLKHFSQYSSNNAS